MILNRTNKTSLDEFLEKRGIEKNDFHLKENSILLQKIIFMKRHQNNNINYNQYFRNLTLNNFYLNHSKRKNIFTRLEKRTKENQLFNENNNQPKKNIIYMNYISNFNKNSKDKNSPMKEEKKYDNLSINCNLFKDTLYTKEENEKEYIFQTSTRRNNISNENILNRINRNNINDNHNKNPNNNSLNKRFFETTYKIRSNKWKYLIPKSNKKLIY